MGGKGLTCTTPSQFLKTAFMANLLDVVKGAVTVALIVCAVRWLNTAKGSDSPKTYGEVAVCGIRWPLRAVAYAGAVLFLVLAFVDLRPDWLAVVGQSTCCLRFSHWEQLGSEQE